MRYVGVTLWTERLKSLLRGNGQPGAVMDAGSRPSNAAWPAGVPQEESTRQSRGLEQFLAMIRDEPTTSILDLGGANQANINYITNLGHRLSTENILHSLDTVWNNPNISEARKIADFIEQTFNYQFNSFGGAIIWDTLQYLPPPLLDATVERLYGLMQPGGFLLAFFHAEDKAPSVPCFNYRIV